ncbi:MAG: CHAT domain-containing protein [Kouleothrix sp.]|nr:CHAT domain-containing protein [Kouleothrix sp.]
MHDSSAVAPTACRRIRSLAERDPRRAVPLARRALDQPQVIDPAARAWARYTLGYALLCWERFDDARPHLLAAQVAFEAVGQALPALRCRFALALADLTQGRPDLERELPALAEQLDRAGAPDLATRARLYQAVLFNVQGRSAEAEALLDRIAPLIAEPADRARWLLVRGVAALARGDPALSADLLEQAGRMFADLHNPLEAAKCRFQLGSALLRQEKLDLALAQYRRAERTFRQIDLPLRLAWCAKGSGLLLARLGRYDEALRAILTALQQFTRLGRIADIGGCQLNFGVIYFYAGRWEAALACYERAEALYDATDVLAERLVARRNRAIVYRAQGRYAEAQALLAELEDRARAGGNQAELAEIVMEQAGVLAATGQIDDSAARYQQARDLFGQLGNLLGAADCALDQGWLAIERGAAGKALDHFRFVEPIVARHPYHRWRTDYGLARCAEASGDAAVALDRYQAALATVADLRQRLVSEELSSGLYAQAARLHVDALRLATAQGDAALAIEIGESQRALVLRRLLAARLAALPGEYAAEHERLRAQIGILLDRPHDERGAGDDTLDRVLAAYGDLLLQARHGGAAPPPAPLDPPLDLAGTRAALIAAYGADWTALLYIVSGDTLLIGTITPERQLLAQTPYDAQLRRLIAQASRPEHRRFTYRDMPYRLGRAARPWAGLGELAGRLLPGQARERLHPGHRLLIVPAGPLHALPWAALRLGDAWLIERAVVQLAPSLATWQSLAGRGHAPSGDALLVGCSAFGERAAALPAVAGELHAVARRWPGDCAQLLDDRATRAALLDRSSSGELERYGLLHFATHAQLLPARGLAAHLKLWDGDMLLPEVAGLRLGGGLVALSACDGAAAAALPGEELLSLSWAFLAAGARGVLASLWPADDEAARGFMAAFYGELDQLHDAPAALAQTQRTLLANGGPAAEPESWASFVFTGAGRLRA